MCESRFMKFLKILTVCTVSLALCSCSAAPLKSPRTAGAELGDPASAEVLGPPPPAEVFGPAQPADHRVVLMLGPGMATAMAAAGVVRTLNEQGIEIALIVGMEAGALVGAAFSSSGSVGGMDWKLLQFKPEWVTPSRGLGAVFGSGKTDPAKLREGLEKIFGQGDAANWRVPVWILGQNGNSLSLLDRGPVAGALAGTLSHPETMEEKGQGSCPDNWTAAIERLKQNGYSQPKVWVIPRLAGMWPHRATAAAAQDARGWLAADDLVIEVEPQLPPGGAAADSAAWAFKQRSQGTYQARQATKRALPSWQVRLGWGS